MSNSSDEKGYLTTTEQTEIVNNAVVPTKYKNKPT